MNRSSDSIRNEWATRLRERANDVSLEYLSGGRALVLRMDRTGRLLLREAGTQCDWEETVNAWSGVVATDRLARLVERLVDAGFPTAGADCMPVPDERFSAITLHHQSGERATMSAFHAAVARIPPLYSVINELDGLCWALIQNPPTETVENPNFDRHPLGQPTLGGYRAVKTEENRARIQRAIDEFYQTYVYVPYRAPEPAPIAPKAESLAEPITCDFRCAITGVIAGTLTITAATPPLGGVWVALTGFAPTGAAQWRVTPESAERLRTAIARSDAHTLWEHNLEMVPFYCGACRACFAAANWQVIHPSASSADGTCPAGHRRRLCAD